LTTRSFCAAAGAKQNVAAASSPNTSLSRMISVPDGPPGMKLAALRQARKKTR
jgi:hypothetical protein